ncbi:hypothetical protein ACU4GD_44625 [Cupriavidus basilensis]
MPQTPPKLVVLDRDGVVNLDSDQFIKTPDEWIPIDGEPGSDRRASIRPAIAW